MKADEVDLGSHVADMPDGTGADCERISKPPPEQNVVKYGIPDDMTVIYTILWINGVA